MKEDGGGRSVDGSYSTVCLDELGLQLVVEEGLWVELQEASSSVGCPNVGPRIAERDECVAVGPTVEAPLRTVVAEIEGHTRGHKTGEFRGKERWADKGSAIERSGKRSAQLLDGEAKRGRDGLVGEEADVADRKSFLLALFEHQGEVPQATAQLLGLG